MRVTGEWLSNDATQKVFRMLTDAGYLAYGVGGCVRNAVLGVAVNDIDISTDARPTTVMKLAQKLGLSVIPTGIDHGTVTVVSGGIPHEITTFRNDVETDGRRAVVAFSDDIADDAVRRDFTMNALYCDADGVVVDPLGGLDDLRARHVRFIQDPSARIQEDYLRILRFFRFFAWYGDQDAGLDPEGLAGCAAFQEGLAQVARERIGAEFLKTLGANDPSQAIAGMAQTGVLNTLLTGADARLLPLVVHGEALLGVTPDVISRLVSLGGQDVVEALRLSRAQGRKYDLLRSEMGTTTGAGELAYRHGCAIAEAIMILRASMFEQPVDPDVADQIDLGENATYPIVAADLMAFHSGPALGKALRTGEQHWIDSGFKASRADVLCFLGVE